MSSQQRSTRPRCLSPSSRRGRQQGEATTKGEERTAPLFVRRFDTDLAPASQYNAEPAPWQKRGTDLGLELFVEEDAQAVLDVTAALRAAVNARRALGAGGVATVKGHGRVAPVVVVLIAYGALDLRHHLGFRVVFAVLFFLALLLGVDRHGRPKHQRGASHHASEDGPCATALVLSAVLVAARHRGGEAGRRAARSAQPMRLRAPAASLRDGALSRAGFAELAGRDAGRRSAARGREPGSPGRRARPAAPRKPVYASSVRVAAAAAGKGSDA
eukprot:CAMPEP_0202112966 /NCGR_PEP_ID=MMETSP0965-20130614/32833_1 /ASSEMBLY_ACC=CAM_ASM_000507 /TAXON_ID=4773 /ORGANISM="Schizochytrium aggregatum, Strain ATCC28209" /LENGTH=272 /DNA_ID=CAMNT_0048682553 /DNA_START=75 /DNA_END=890 /DNA_ORIENTATION=-